MKALSLSNAAMLEGTTLIILLFIAVPLKRMMGFPEAVSLIGPIHGIAFIIYLMMLTGYLTKDKINLSQWLTGLFAAFIPFGSFIFERKILRSV